MGFVNLFEINIAINMKIMMMITEIPIVSIRVFTKSRIIVFLGIVKIICQDFVSSILNVLPTYAYFSSFTSITSPFLLPKRYFAEALINSSFSLLLTTSMKSLLFKDEAMILLLLSIRAIFALIFFASFCRNRDRDSRVISIPATSIFLLYLSYCQGTLGLLRLSVQMKLSIRHYFYLLAY